MRYKTVIAALLLLAVTVMPGCSSEEKRAYALSDAGTLLDAGVFDGEMAEMRVSARTMAMLYGVDEGDIRDFVSFQATNTTVSADEVTVLILVDEAAAERAEAACRSRIESEIKNYEAYCPAAIPNLKGAVIDRVGNTVLVAVGDPRAVSDAVKALRG